MLSRFTLVLIWGLVALQLSAQSPALSALNQGRPLFANAPFEVETFFTSDGIWWVASRSSSGLALQVSSDQGATWQAAVSDWQQFDPDTVTGLQLVRTFQNDVLLVVAGLRNSAAYFWILRPTLNAKISTVQTVSLSEPLSNWAATSLSTGRFQIAGSNENKLFFWTGADGNSPERSSWYDWTNPSSKVEFRSTATSSGWKTLVVSVAKNIPQIEILTFTEDALIDRKTVALGFDPAQSVTLAFPGETSLSSIALIQGSTVWGVSNLLLTPQIWNTALSFPVQNVFWVNPDGPAFFEGLTAEAQTLAWQSGGAIQTAAVSGKGTLASRIEFLSGTWQMRTYTVDSASTTLHGWSWGSSGWTETQTWTIGQIVTGLVVTTEPSGPQAVWQTDSGGLKLYFQASLAQGANLTSPGISSPLWNLPLLAYDPQTLVGYMTNKIESNALNQMKLIPLGGSEQ